MRITLLFCLLLGTLSLTAQVNGYARVSAISGAELTVVNVNESSSLFELGKDVIIMQMQDDVIGGNTGNNSGFGDLAGIGSAGLYEVRTIVSVTRVGDDLSAITLDAAPQNSYNLGANSRVQVITFELLGGGGDFTTTAAIPAVSWNGQRGGVVAFQVQGMLTVAHTIHADGRGFQGGAPVQTTAGACDLTTFRAAANARHAFKGEGIYRVTDTDHAAALGKILNGGGGGNDHNGGGGGGGNYTAGGNAGPGWNCGAGNAGGLGGIALAAHIGADRVFLGGGGGGGHGNNNVATAGVRGGGIVLIKAERLRTSGNCGVRRISANGATASNAGNDGAGGGGAGGSIILDVVDFDLSSNCPLSLEANGGNGGTVNSSTHGGGGGGGQGVVIFSTNAPTGNATVSTSNGAGGCNNNSNPCDFVASSGQGTGNAGILENLATPLPVELLAFQAVAVGDRVDVSWSTAVEIDNDHFQVQRSVDRQEWEVIGYIEGAGTTYGTRSYRHIDEAPLPGTSYYRLVQVDIDGSTSASHTVPVHFVGRTSRATLFPNPARDRVELRVDGGAGDGIMDLTDATGRVVMLGLPIRAGVAVFYVGALPPGTYTALVRTDDGPLRQRLIVAR